MNILFICTGNTCRSPMAEAILKHNNHQGIQVKSAGVFAMDGADASIQAKEVLKENDIIHKHQSSSITREKLDWASYIFTMTQGHKWAIVDQYPHIADKIFTLKEYVLEDPEDLDVSDPYGGSVEIYRHTYNELDSLIGQLMDKLERE
ncbi:low molecular weight protein arginine phosphatase [Rossellomorea marisflavi]|uniref:low molecular weight protein arginine phosphatase n=1 Tax=Rossellomorea TaxID=2837508 RepID=UPI00064FD961|nr:low molecular weight protein arginine phosphatase [Rossellomorea marisflavi]VXC51633.1 protein-arginine(tyrosine moonlighting) phosphatase (oxidative stress) [Bacillus sp. 349Y]KMK95891.1 phosphatase [Rossellomorea marisflavi]KML33414.1 phosphatase [Rossellomorea marisflavi]MCM2604358.1 low molecular weight protein arginine phosphatase [Rossellomorea marisflavi]QHA37991.1 low molecular weight protein arginine phosphatase [Rossellomorea marisflavi]